MIQGKIMKSRTLRKIGSGLLLGEKQEQIAQDAGVSRSTITRVKQKLIHKQIHSIDEWMNLTDEEVVLLYYDLAKKKEHKDFERSVVLFRNPPKKDGMPIDYKSLAKLCIDRRLKKRVLYFDYEQACRKEQKKAVSRSQFYKRLGEEIRLLKGPNVYMIQEHPYGKELQIDFAGRKWKICDQNGQMHAYSICVLTWAASNYTYAQLTYGQRTKDVCLAIGNALNYFGCCPVLLNCDNAKSMVTSHQTGRDAKLNDTFQYFMDRLGILVVPSNPRSPTSKSACELSVRLIQDHVLPRMTEGLPKSVHDYNVQLQEFVEKYINAVPFREHATKTPRRELFHQEEKRRAASLRDIPQYIEHQSFIRVPKSYHIDIDGVKYSVPYRLADKFVDVDRVDNQIRIYADRSLVAVHGVGLSGQVLTLPEHMPQHHLAVREKRKRYPDAQAILMHAKNLSLELFRLCQILMKEVGFEKKKQLCIYMINLYRKKWYQKAELDESIRRLMSCGLPPEKWYSSTLEKIGKELKKQPHHKKWQYQINSGFVADENTVYLRSDDAFALDNAAKGKE